MQQILDACPRLGVETVPLEQSIGRVLRQDVVSPNDFPPFHRVMMDGYAVRVEDLQDTQILPCKGEAAAGSTGVPALTPGCCVQVMTGAPLPEGADAVVMVEETEETEGGIRFGEPVRAGQHFAVRGEEAKEGAVLLRDGDVITPVSVATIASAGLSQVAVSRRPSLAIVSTGDELVPLDQEPGPSQIRDTNSWSLTAQALADGLVDVVRLHALDNQSHLTEILGEAMQRDVVIISGGVSAGKYDLVPGVLAELGVEQQFHRVFQKPGKPLWFGTRGGTLVFGAPGNPLATVVTFRMYVRAAIAQMMGRPTGDVALTGRLSRDVTYRAKRDVFVFVRVSLEQGVLKVVPLPGKGSADVFAPAPANALIAFPAGTHELHEGDQVQLRMLGGDAGRL